MFKRTTCTLLALAWVCQIPCAAGDNLGKQLLRDVVDTGKGQLNKSALNAAKKVTGVGTTTANTAAKTATGTAATTATTAEKAATKTVTSAATTAEKSTEKTTALSKHLGDAATKYGQKYGDQYLNKGTQQLDKLLSKPTKLK